MQKILNSLSAAALVIPALFSHAAYAGPETIAFICKSQNQATTTVSIENNSIIRVTHGDSWSSRYRSIQRNGLYGLETSDGNFHSYVLNVEGIAEGNIAKPLHTEIDLRYTTVTKDGKELAIPTALYLMQGDNATEFTCNGGSTVVNLVAINRLAGR